MSYALVHVCTTVPVKCGAWQPLRMTLQGALTLLLTMSQAPIPAEEGQGYALVRTVNFILILICNECTHSHHLNNHSYNLSHLNVISFFDAELIDARFYPLFPIDSQ